MKRLDEDTYVLSSGRSFKANHGLISLAHQTGGTHYKNLGGPSGHFAHWGQPNCGIFEVSEGFDGTLWDIEDWTPEERAELADYMIEQWQRFKFAFGDR